jgi:thiamine biosynthesis lipoprotein
MTIYPRRRFSSFTNRDYYMLVRSFCSLFSTSFILSTLAIHDPVEAKEFTFHHENVLGTSLELRIETDNVEAAKRAEAIALQEIDRLCDVFSHYSKTSEFAKLANLPIGDSMNVSPDLAGLLRRCEKWIEVSDGAFNPGAEFLSRRWQLGMKLNQAPTTRELQQDVTVINQRHWTVQSDSNSVTRNSASPLSLNAIAKGTILDNVAQSVMDRAPEVRGLCVNIGGDVRVAGSSAQWVSIPNPNSDMLESSPLQNLSLTKGAIATSGVSERSIKIGDQSYSHIFDPRTGQPCNHVISASVIAPDAETADVLATICSVLPTTVSVALVESIPGCQCLLVDFSGALIASSLWPENGLQEGSKTGGASKVAENQPKEFTVAFEINKAVEGGRYRRPYVAVWVEDKDGFPVKTLSLFLMADNPGPRWHRDLRRWYSSDQMRLLVDQKKLIGTISKPTSNPGSYKVGWDGSDDNGKPLPDGKYTLYIEAAREHGTYQLMKSPFTLGTGDFELKLEGNIEIKAASMSFKKRK